MTYNPRLIKKQKGFIVNGSVAILIPKEKINLTQQQQDYIASEEFRNFYKIARNYQTRTLNIDNTSCFWFGIQKGVVKMQTQQIINFLNNYDYDIRKRGSARWIDQKYTCDVLPIIADCILEYTNYDTNAEFSISDIWHSEYAESNVRNIFSKPSTQSKLAKNEYDKFFSQPINLFTYSGILIFLRKQGTTNIFKINNLELLEFIPMQETNALTFLILYIKKVLSDSGIYGFFQNF